MRLDHVVAALLACVLAALVALGIKLPALGISGLTLVVPLVLVSPAGALLAWAATGPALGGWLGAAPGAGLPAVTPDRVILLVLVVVFAIRWMRAPRTVAAPGAIEILMAIFLALAVITAIAGGGTHDALGGGGLRADLIVLMQSYAIPFLAYFLAKNLLAEHRYVRPLMWIYIATGAFIAATTILHHFTGISTFLPTRYNIIHEGRETGTLASANHLGIILAVCVLPAIILLRRSRTLLQSLLLTGSIGLTGVAMYLARTRAPYLGLAAALGVGALYERRLRRPLLTVALAVILTLIVAWPLIVQLEFVKARLLERSPVYNRVALAATSMNMFVHSPILGYGFGRYTFRDRHVDYLAGAGGVSRDYAHYFDVPHNEFLHILILLGCAGFLPYVALFVLAWRACDRAMRRRTAPEVERDLTMVALGGLVIYVANGLAADMMFCWYGSNLVFTLLGVVAGLRLRAEAREATPV